jgi:hypothetical protein
MFPEHRLLCGEDEAVFVFPPLTLDEELFLRKLHKALEDGTVNRWNHACYVGIGLVVEAVPLKIPVRPFLLSFSPLSNGADASPCAGNARPTQDQYA